MESTEAGSIEDSLDSKNLEASMEDIVVAKYEDCNSEVLSSQNEEDQSGEQVYGYLEVRNPGSEDATIILDSEGFNLNGQRLILTQNDDGNGIIVVVSEDPDGQPLEQTFAHASVLHSDEVNFEDGLKEHGALVMDEHSQGLEFIETEEVPQEHEERHVYIENSGGLINISSENQCSPVNSVNIEQPLWSVSNSAQIKNDSTEMLFIPNPTVVLAPEETKHRKLMQLACIAHELQSADQKSSTTVVSESAKDAESSLSEFETSVIVTQNEVSKDPNVDLIGISGEVKDSENVECLPGNDNENNHIDCNSKTVSKSVDIASLLSCTSSRAVDNTVSVIHTTSSELQDNSLENQTKDSSPSDFPSVQNYHHPESDIPSEMLYSSEISRVSLHDSLDEEPTNSKQLEECEREDLEENSQLSIADDSNGSKSPRTNVAVREMELDCSPRDDDSPITFIEKSQELDDVDTLGIEDNPLGEAGADIRVDDDDSHAGSSCIVVVEDDESKEPSNLPVTTRDNFSTEESHLLKDTGTNQRTSLRKNKISADADSELSTSDYDDTGIHEHGASSSKNDLRLPNKKYLYKYKSKTPKSYLTKNSTLSPVLQDNRSPDVSSQYDLDESNVDNSSSKKEVNKCDSMDFEDSPPDNLESDLVIAENVDEEELNSNTNDSRPDKDETQNLSVEGTLESPSIKNTEKLDSEKTDIPEKKLENLKEDSVQGIPVDIQSVSKEYEKDNSSIKAAETNLDSSAVDDDFSYNEETLVKTPIKTYIRKKSKKNVVENKSSIKENIELFSVDDLNFTECDKDINDVENSLNLDQNKESISSSQENNAESDDHLLLSDVQSKVSATYNRKKKSLLPIKQGQRTRSLRPRSLPAKLPLENGTQEISDSESKKNSFDSSSSENIPWGDVLMSTSFQPRTETNKNEPSTSFASKKSSITSSTPLLSPEQRKRKLNKYTRDFERLLHSSPVRSKKLKTSTKRQIPRGRKRILKSRRSSELPSSSFSEFLGPYESSHRYNVGASTSTVGEKRRREVKKAEIHNLNQNTIKYQDEPPKKADEIFACSTCTFVSTMVDNLIEHLKYCKSTQPVLAYRVYDMEKRQMIRGDDSFEKEEVTGGCNGTMRNNDRRNSSQGEFSGGQNQDLEEGLDLDFISDNKRRKKTQYGYGEDDVVWVKYKDRFWPALVCEIRGSKAHVRLIKHPEAEKGLKVKHENIRTFDDAKWNCLCLKEAVSLPNNAIFVKSVQSAETFMRRKFLGFNVKGKTFFSVREGVDFATDTASSDSIVEDSDDDDEAITIRFPAPSRKFRYESLDKERILGYILEGTVNDYVLDIFKEKVHSEKHLKFFDHEGRLDLEHRPWFGPFEEKSEKERLFFHFRELFGSKVGEEICKKRKFSMTAYVTQVLIPEAIVKAISVVNAISIEEAETLFESEDSLEMDCDPEPEEIHKMYS